MLATAPETSIKVEKELYLQLIEEHHAEPLLALVNSNRDHLSEWFPWVPYMQTVEDFQNYIRRCKLQHQEGTDYGYVIVYNGRLAGRIGIHYIQQQNKTGAIGYWLGKAFEGKGIITKACAALLEHCFTRLHLNRIEIKCGTGNHRSAAIPQRLHFTKEGILRQAEWVNGHFIDLSLYSLLREEWDLRFANASTGKGR
jgi:ribosomal-protein-serine acetyltransferase